jgi:hypothetical protein
MEAQAVFCMESYYHHVRTCFEGDDIPSKWHCEDASSASYINKGKGIDAPACSLIPLMHIFVSDSSSNEFMARGTNNEKELILCLFFNHEW